MATLQIEHEVNDFAVWKEVFDRDPLDRPGNGVRRHRLRRPVDNQNLVVGELEFDSIEEAQSFAEKLRELWKSPQASQMMVGSPTARVVELVEEGEY